MAKIEIDMSYDEILARKTKLERDVADIEHLIALRDQKQAELDKWSALEQSHRPKKVVDPLEGLPGDTEGYLNGTLLKNNNTLR